MSASSSGVIVGVVVGGASGDEDAGGVVGGTDGKADPLDEAPGSGEVPGGDAVGALVEQATTARRKAGSSAARRMSGTSDGVAVRPVVNRAKYDRGFVLA